MNKYSDDFSYNHLKSNSAGLQDLLSHKHLGPIQAQPNDLQSFCDEEVLSFILENDAQREPKLSAR